MMSEIKYEDLILEAIDQLRRRKARPDAERIFNCLYRRRGVGSAESNVALEKCVDVGSVLRVCYKGNISYRNAANKKFARPSRPPSTRRQRDEDTVGGEEKPNSNKPRRKFTHLLTSAFADLVLEEPDYLHQGVPPLQLIKTILDKDCVRYTKKYLLILLEKEVENGGLVQLEGGNFLVGKAPSPTRSKKAGAKKPKFGAGGGGNPGRKTTSNVRKFDAFDFDEVDENVNLKRRKVDVDERVAARHRNASATSATVTTATTTTCSNGGNGATVDDTTTSAPRMAGTFSLATETVATSTATVAVQVETNTNSAALAADISPVFSTTTTTTTPSTGTAPSPRHYKKGILEKARARLMEKEKHSDNDDKNNLRVGGRRKKAKKVFDPSESNMPKRRGRPLGSVSTKFPKLPPAKQPEASPSPPRPESQTSVSAASPQQPAPTCAATPATVVLVAAAPASTVTEGGVCSVCHLENKKAPSEKMVSCRECSNKAHASCLNGDDMMLKMYPDNTWQCPHCKTCVVCYETSGAGNLVVCSICADAYHNTCHSPRIAEKLKLSTKWLCNNCQMAEQLAVDKIQIGFGLESQPQPQPQTQRKSAPPIDETTNTSRTQSPDLSRTSSPHFVSTPSSPTLPTLSPQMAQNGQNNSESESDSKSEINSILDVEVDENIDPSIPDASNWTPDEVANYFSQYFPEEASVFKEQEIDGHSLLLMRRMDVLKGLSLKLGPALKIYRHVLKLQYRRDDPKLYWV